MENEVIIKEKCPLCKGEIKIKITKTPLNSYIVEIIDGCVHLPDKKFNQSQMRMFINMLKSMNEDAIGLFTRYKRKQQIEEMKKMGILPDNI